jgi:glycosyltransferase involved in cell wall biosynthesis
MNKPYISVVMSVYKEPVEWLSQSIDSILHQTFSDFEFLIICDNPAYKEGIDLLKNYARKDNRIRLFFNEDNIGLTKSLNKGFIIAQGEFIARMDADDIAMTERFAKQLEYLDSHPEIGVCGSIIKYIGDREGMKYFPEKYEDMYLFLETPFAHPTVMIRKAILPKANCYDEEYVVSQDYALWTELYAKGVQFYNIQEPLLQYRVSGQQIMAKKNSVQHQLACKIRRKALDYYNARHNVTYKINKKAITLDEIDAIKYQMKLPHNVMGDLLFYLYISNDSSVFRKLWHLFSKGNASYIKMANIARIIKYQIKNLDAVKF